MTRRWRRLIESERAGSQRAQHRRGHSQGDFYGLREWRAGDSLRWIHWRTSAKLNELAVRQFEQHRCRDSIFVLDLYRPQKATSDQDELVERAVSFVATAVADLCRQGASRLCVTFLGQTQQRWTGMASRPFGNLILGKLAETEGGAHEATEMCLQKALETTSSGSRVVVVSTRSVPSGMHEQFHCVTDGAASQRMAGRMAWVDVGSEGVAEFFEERPSEVA